MQRLHKTFFALILFATSNVLAQPASHSEDIRIGRMVINEDGTKNPMEFKLDAMPFQKPSTFVCMAGYIFTKSGSHEIALKHHQKCADAGYQRSMLWLSYVYQNGYSTEERPDLSAYWDMRAAEAGNEVGMFNFGLDLLRGYGVGHYVVAGQYWINRAASAGHKRAIELREADYDLTVVTPDVDEARWKSAS